MLQLLCATQIFCSFHGRPRRASKSASAAIFATKEHTALERVVENIDHDVNSCCKLLKLLKWWQQTSLLSLWQSARSLLDKYQQMEYISYYYDVAVSRRCSWSYGHGNICSSSNNITTLLLKSSSQSGSQLLIGSPQRESLIVGDSLVSVLQHLIGSRQRCSLAARAITQGELMSPAMEPRGLPERRTRAYTPSPVVAYTPPWSHVAFPSDVHLLIPLPL